MRSKAALSFCILALLCTAVFIYPKWEKTGGQAAIGWDVSGYYWYLPSIFIYKDLKHQKFGDSIISKYQPTPTFEQSFVYNNGNRVNTYTAGMAIMYLPFFTIAHFTAHPAGYPADGFSMPYQRALWLGSLLVAFIGLFYFRRLLLCYFTDSVVAITLLLLTIGTNYLNYAAIDNTLTHSWLFTLYVLLLLNTHHFYKAPSAKHAIRIGLLTGLLILIRPTEIIAIIIPLAWELETIRLKAIKERLGFFKQHFQQLLIAGICTIAVGSIQIVYWLYVSGKPFVYSYQEKGFSWLHPHFFSYIFSYRSGWFTYTPMVLLLFAGAIIYMFKGPNKIAFLLFAVINLYIVCAWDI